MSDALSFAEIAGQHVELLPVRTVLSTGGAGGPGGDATASVYDNYNFAHGPDDAVQYNIAVAVGGDGGAGGEGGAGGTNG